MKRPAAGTAEIVRHALVRQIRLTHSRCETQIRTPADIPPDAALTITSGGRVAEPPDAEGWFRVQARVEVRVSSETAGKPELALIEAVYEVLYRIPAELKPPADALEEFAETNGVFNAWPYMRQFVAETAQRMEVPPIVLPLFRPATKLAGRKRKPRPAGRQAKR